MDNKNLRGTILERFSDSNALFCAMPRLLKLVMPASRKIFNKIDKLNNEKALLVDKLNLIKQCEALNLKVVNA